MRAARVSYIEAQRWIAPAQAAIDEIRAKNYRATYRSVMDLDLLGALVDRMVILSGYPAGPKTALQELMFAIRINQISEPLVRAAECWVDYVSTSYLFLVPKQAYLIAMDVLADDFDYYLETKPAYNPGGYTVQRKRKRVVIVEPSKKKAGNRHSAEKRRH